MHDHDSTLYHIDIHDVDSTRHANTASGPKPYECGLWVGQNQVPVRMEIDTRASVTIIGEMEYHRLCTSQELLLDSTTELPKLRTYNGKIILVLGWFSTTRSHGTNEAELSMYVAKRDGPNLLGRDSLREKAPIFWVEMFEAAKTKLAWHIHDVYWPRSWG